MAVLTVKVIKSHDGIQQGTILRFAECPAIRYMIDNGYYQLVKAGDDAKKTDSKKSRNNKKRK
jgi:hypothetical protein